MFATPALVFLVSEASGTSGILSLIFVSLILRLYAKPNLKKDR